MRRDARAHLADVLEAGRQITRITADLDLESYRADDVRRWAVERQFEIMGEALSRLTRTNPDLAAGISDIGTIIGFRNVLAHGYDIVDHEVVWRTITDELPALVAEASRLLDELGE